MMVGSFCDDKISASSINSVLLKSDKIIFSTLVSGSMNLAVITMGLDMKTFYHHLHFSWQG